MISAARAQNYLGVQGDESYIEQLIAGQVAFVESETGRYLGEPKTVIDLRNGLPNHLGLIDPAEGRRLPVVWLSHRPNSLSDIASVEIRTLVSESWESLDLETSDVPPEPNFELDGRRLYRIDGFGLPVGRRTVQVTYTAGYDVDMGPINVSSLVLDLVALAFKPSELRGKGSVVSVSGRSNTVRWSEKESLPASIQARLDALKEKGMVP